MEDGWKGEEDGDEEEKEREEGITSEEGGKTRQSHEEHMRQLAGMAISHPLNRVDH